MKIDEYQELAMRTCPFDDRDFGSMITHAVFGMCSETGEIAGIFQKTYQGRDIDFVHLKRELGDVCWFVAEACTAMGVSLEDVMECNIQKLKDRFPEGFDPYLDQHRKQGDI